MSKPIEKRIPAPPAAIGDYPGLVGGISELVEAAWRGSARTVNAFMTATYWEVGRRIVEFEQGGENRAKYGKELLKRLAEDLTARHGRGFSVDNLENMRLFYGVCGSKEISETLSRELGTALPASSGTSLNSETPSRIFQTASGQSPALPCNLADVARAFPLPWSHYVLLVRHSRSPEAFAFYHTETLRGGLDNAHQLFDEQLPKLLDELNQALAA